MASVAFTTSNDEDTPLNLVLDRIMKQRRANRDGKRVKIHKPGPVKRAKRSKRTLQLPLIGTTGIHSVGSDSYGIRVTGHTAKGHVITTLCDSMGGNLPGRGDREWH